VPAEAWEPDGRAHTVADSTKVRQLDAGYLQDDKVVAAITDVLAEMGKRFRESIQATDEADLVTQDRIALVACWIRVPRRQGRCPPPSRRQRK
jgi:DNA-binding ferritin-like protein